MWRDDQRDALLRAIERLAERPEIEEVLGRAYDLRASESEHGVEYGGPDVGGWIRVRYDTEGCALAAVFVPA